MRAILIDPYKACIELESGQFVMERSPFELVEHEGGLQSIYKHLSGEPDAPHKVRCVDVAWLDNGDGIYVDDEGLLKSGHLVWQIDGITGPLAGRGLIVGMDKAGKDAPSVTDLRKIKKNWKFLGTTK